MAESDDLREVVFAAAARADALRAEGLRGLTGLTEARQAGLERERARLSAALGGEHPRVAALAHRLAAGAARLRDLGADVARAEAVAPRVSAGEWALHGFVRRTDGGPAPDLTVALVDAKGQWIRALGVACTDARGYFKVVAALPRKDATTPGAPPGQAAHIRITDANRAILHQEAEAVSVSPGGVEYQEITLEGASRGCATPEEDVSGPGPGDPARPPQPRGRARPRK